MNTLKYFEDYNLKRDAEIGKKGRLWMDIGINHPYAWVAELVDARDLKSLGA